MLNTVRKKLASNSGETLVETLVAVMVSAMSMLMLAMAISTGYGLISQSKANADEYYAASSNLAAETTTVTEACTVAMSGGLKDETATTQGAASVAVNYTIEEGLPGNVTGIAYRKAS